MDTQTDVDRLSARAAEIKEREAARLLERTARSRELFERRAVRTMPMGVASSFQAADPYPIYLERGQGSHVWDVDGAEYVDYHNGFGCMVVGHAHPKVVEAIDRAARTGTHFAVTTPVTMDLADELCRRFGLEKVRFSNSGTEATMDALRIARAASGRDRVIKIEGSYHGHVENPWSTPFSRGIPARMAEDLVVVPFNDPTALRRVLEEDASREGGPTIGTMIVEPVMMNIGVVPPVDDYLRKVRDLCTKHGVVLIFDEVKTGATIAPGGAIEMYGVQPDLACFAKAIGGGVPIGALGGTDAVMGEIGNRLAHQGTFNGNPLAMHAGLATLTEVLVPDAYEHLAKLGTQLAEGCAAAIERSGVPAHVRDFGSKGCVSYRSEPLTSYRDYLETHEELFYASWNHIVNRGVFMTPGDEEQWTISVQHSEDDIARYVDAFGEFCEELVS
jgi:glutamate-1-semialdehyde 2,1-aminomutase